MPVKSNVLTIKQVREVAKEGDGVTAIGGGVSLRMKGGVGSLLFRYRMPGARHPKDLPLCAFNPSWHNAADVLERVRHQVTGYKLDIKDGKDPLAAKIAERQYDLQREVARQEASKPVNEVLEAFYAKREKRWCDQYRKETKREIDAYVVPILDNGKLPVCNVTADHLKRILDQPMNGSTLWESRNVTARRIRARLGEILRFAKGNGWREGDGVEAWWRERLVDVFAKASEVHSVKHHRALAWKEVPDCMAKLAKRDLRRARMLEFLILNASRADEVISMRWQDVQGDTWHLGDHKTVRDIGKRRLPLSRQALAILASVKPADAKPEDLIWPGNRKNGKASDDQLRRECRLHYPRKEGDDHLKPHGFRSSFTDWCGDNRVPLMESEFQLGHVEGSRTRQAYARSDLLELRRELMQRWADYIMPTPRNNVVRIDQKLREAV